MLGQVRLLAAVLFLAAIASVATAGEADVVGASAEQDPNGTWRFEVTVRHDDEGWDHYADLWEVRAPDGTVLGSRTLLHPHENEQPFTRNLAGVEIPEEVETVEIRARDSVHGFGGEVVRIRLPD